MSYLLGKYISDEGKENIKNHKYVPGEYSALDNLLNPFWIWIVEFLPKWMAPNLVTLLGLIALGGSYLLMLAFDLSMTKPLPGFTYLLVAIGIWTFQTLDAIDGKQARRTGSSSPLGQLFDHGCDAVSWAFCNMSVVSFLGLGLSFSGILSIYASIGPFFFTNLLEYYSGVYIYSVGLIDATTGQYLLIFFNFLPFLVGGDFYQGKVSDSWTFMPSILSDGYLFKDYAMIVVVYVGVIYSIILVFKTLNSVKGAYVKFVVTLQIIQHIGIYALMYLFDPNIPFIKNNAGLVYLSVVFLFVLVTCKLIICHMAKMDYNVIHFEFLVFAPYFYLQSQYNGTQESENTLKLVFYATFVVMFFITFRFIQTCINQLTEYLGIYCFSIEKRKEKSS
ncbi:unnamed protein product [Moneuplotes crassus]|uniref:Ethanolaminephosphotransferase n=1 Tax=Euplotes crassus TaxID=5936 RepID=A0AAD1USP7_EUPCR|nr:unnamed protein product [Moneuplotes crassus]